MEFSRSLLNGLGLSEAEGKVYLAALELGEASIQEISRKSGVKRTTIYNFIDELKSKQVISETKRGKRSVYRAANPRQLEELLKLRVNEFQRALPELISVFEGARHKPRVTFYEGVEGIKEVYSDALQEGLPISAVTDWEHMMIAMGDWLKDYPVERARREIPFKQISRDTKKAREISLRDKAELRTTKFLETEDLKTEVMIYGDKVAVMSFRGALPFGFIVEDPDTAQTIRVLWNELWKRL